LQTNKLIYLLPNLFTASSVFVGVVSLVEAGGGHFVRAAWFILLALLLDGLDGRIARLTSTTSRFGVEFDSLADIVSFGVAPAMLIYYYTGYHYGKLGTLISGLYVVLGAIRLARFNVTTSRNDPNVFIGLPIPTAAVLISASVLLAEEYSWREQSSILMVLAPMVAILMVSNFRYPSFKSINLDRKNVNKTLISMTIAASMLYLFSAEGFVLIVLGYVLYGPIRALYIWRRYGTRH